MATLEENITQAIADFDDIEAAIKAQGVEVPVGTDTSEYGDFLAGNFVGGLLCSFIKNPEKNDN